MLYNNFLNVDVKNDFMNKYARLSLERICWFVIWFCIDLKDSSPLHI